MKDIIESELQAIDGGVLPWILTALGGAAIGIIANGWSDFKQGATEAFWHEQNVAY